MRNRLLFLFGVLCCVFSGAMAEDKATSEDITVDGTKRNMLVYAPADLPDNSPLLISMHGMNQNAPYQQEMANWEAVAKEEKFVVVYPSAIGTGFTTWDIQNTSVSQNKDFKFLVKIIDEMTTRYKIDTKRVYLLVAYDHPRGETA